MVLLSVIFCSFPYYVLGMCSICQKFSTCISLYGINNEMKLLKSTFKPYLMILFSLYQVILLTVKERYELEISENERTPE